MRHIKVFNNLKTEQKISVFFILFIFLSIPLTVALVLQVSFFLSRAKVNQNYLTQNQQNINSEISVTPEVLPDAYVGEEYKSFINLISDTVYVGDLKVTGLPSGLAYKSCFSNGDVQGKPLLSCEVFGFPLVEGNFDIQIVLNSKYYPVRINVLTK